MLTDASTGLIDVAKARFKGFTNLEFTCLDIERDLVDQDLGDEEFDLIIAAGVLHVTTDVARSLSNIWKLLSPKGRLLVQEPSSGLLWTKFILGTLPSWWSGQDDSRPDELFMSRARWTEKLNSARFSCPNFVDGDIPANLVGIQPNASILSVQM